MSTTESGPSTMTDSTISVEPCPGCWTISGVAVITGTAPTVQAWSCSACRTDWAVSVVNPRPYLDHLTAAVNLTAARSVLREITVLAEEAPALTDEQLWFRLRALAGCAAPRSAAARSPIGRRSSLDAPDSALGGWSDPDPRSPMIPAGYRSNRPVPGVQPVPPLAGADHADLAGR
jgi:hypothetical protein